MNIATIGLDLAKSVFQAHGVDGAGKTVLVKKLHRKQMLPFFSKLPPCLIGVEACATAHHWARTLIAMGHDVRIMPPSYVKGYVKRGKSDALDAEAICEAVTRPTMRFVAVKSAEQQSVLMLHRTREVLVRQRTMLVNAIRAHMAEFGIVARVGLPQVKELLAVIADAEDAKALRCKAIVELANRPILPAADKALQDAGIEVVPDILANGGGVTISHAEWVQGRQGIDWNSDDVDDYLEDTIAEASENVREVMQECDTDMRTAAYAVALRRLCAAISAHGTRADFGKS